MGYGVEPIEIRFADPYVILNYSDYYLDVQDHFTHCVSLDMWIDLRINTIQPCHNVLVFSEPKHLTIAGLYLARYDKFTYTLVQAH